MAKDLWEGETEAAIREPGDLNARKANPSARNGTEAHGGQLSGVAFGKGRPPGGNTVRKHLIGTSAILALAVIAACGSSPSTATTSPPSTCVNASAPHRAYVVVQHLSGATIQKCVGFTGDTIDGQTVMDKSTIQFETQTFSFGKGVCQIDSEPAQFSKCFPEGKPYWTLWIETGAKWASAQTGYTDVKLHDKEAMGWHYVQSTDPSPAPPPLAKP